MLIGPPFDGTHRLEVCTLMIIYVLADLVPLR
jgi:hypothetical protein